MKILNFLKVNLLALSFISLILIGCGESSKTVEKTNKVVADTKQPVFTSASTVNINENQPNIITLVALDDSAITYAIKGDDSSFLNLNTSSGLVSFKVNPDYETKATYVFTAVAKDSYNNESTQNIIVNILDLNENTKTVVHNEKSYNTIVSPYTKRIWLDRNVGALKSCSARDDSSCYGDYYQWGRSTDGHEKASSSIVIPIVATLKNAGSSFIQPAKAPFDWTSADINGKKRSNDWSSVDGTSVCPVGFRIPSHEEFKAETVDAPIKVTSTVTAFSNFLKLPSAGGRKYFNGNTYALGLGARYWTSSVHESTSWTLGFNETSADFNVYTRAEGLLLRCISDK